METTQKIFYSGEDYEKCYFFAPSISHKKNVSGKQYFVRRYFQGGKDFEKAISIIYHNFIQEDSHETA